jgi:hypothetical protein
MQLSRRWANQTLNGRAMGAAMARRERVMSAVPVGGKHCAFHTFKVDRLMKMSIAAMDLFKTKIK